jgi:hypothetical protein
MAEPDDEQRALQERHAVKQAAGTSLGPENAQFWNSSPLTAEQLQVVLPTLGIPATVEQRIEDLIRSVDALREQVAENTRAVAELKKTIKTRWESDE